MQESNSPQPCVLGPEIEKLVQAERDVTEEQGCPHGPTDGSVLGIEQDSGNDCSDF